MNNNSDHRIQFVGRRKEQQHAPHSYRTQVIAAQDREEAEQKLKERFNVKEIY